MVNERFGEGLFDGEPREEPRRGPRRDESHSWDDGDGDDGVDQGRGLPWVGVHVVTQFVFCPRAGMLAYEEGRTDDGSDLDRPPKLDHMPDYLPEIIEEKLDGVRRDLWAFATYASLWVMLLALIAFVHPVLVVMLFAASLVFVPSVYRLVRNYLLLRHQKLLALGAKGRAPDPNIAATQIVNWWELLKADYEPTRPKEPHDDRALRLCGKPHLILTHKGQRIPVIRKWTGKEELHRKDYARCGAYAHLIETCEHTKTPFAIILFGNGYDGVAVPITASASKAFRDGLSRARRVLEEVAGGDLAPAKPESGRICGGCRYGRPRLYQRGKSETVLGEARLEAQRAEAHNGKDYHCTCGDRFGGLPPHKLAIALGLTD